MNELQETAAQVSNLAWNAYQGETLTAEEAQLLKSTLCACRAACYGEESIFTASFEEQFQFLCNVSQN